MLNFLWDAAQQGQIAQAKAQADSAESEAKRSGERIRELEGSLHRMALVSQALWELVRGRLDLSEADIMGKVSEIDLRDGSSDGRMSPRVTLCPNCNRTLSTRNTRCLYCGAAVPKPHVFQ